MNCDFSTCTARPQTAAGAAYLRVAMDPCGEQLPPAYAGIPDGSEIDLVPLQMRDDLVLNAPSDLEPDETWGIVIFDTPYFVYQQIMIRYRRSTGPPEQSQVREFINGLTRAEVNNNVTFPNWFRPIRRAFESMSNPDAPTIIVTPDVATWEVSMLKPAVLTTFSSDPQAEGWSYIRKFRCVAKGRTLHLNAPATATQGRMVSGQLGTESSVKVIAQGPNPNSQSLAQPCRFTVTPPFDFNILPQQDLNARQDIIKTGSYDMQRHWNGAHIWNEIADVRPIWRANLSNLSAVWVTTDVFFEGVGTTNFNQLMKYDGFDVSLGWTVTHIDGMSGVASVHMKHRSRWEVNVPGSSPWAANKTAPCPHDAGALSLEKQLGPVIPHSFEAKFNDLGLLASAIKGITSIGKAALSGAGSAILSRASQALRKVVIDDPYAGLSLYGDNGFVAGGGNGNGNGRRRRKR